MTPTDTPTRKDWWWVPVVISLLVYLPSLGNGMVWDDHKAFTLYPYYTDLRYLGRAFTEPFVFSPDYYRPLTSSTFVIQNHLFDTSAAAMHAGSVILHAANTLLVGLLARSSLAHWQKLGRYRLLPLAIATIYAVHPALIEAVAWISVRFDLLVTFFMLLALWLDGRVWHPVGRPLAVGLAFLLAALSKEMALALAIGLPFWHLARAQEKSRSPKVILAGMRERGELAVYLGVVAFGLVYLVIRYQALGYILLGQQVAGAADASAVARLLLVFRTYCEYGSIIVMPFGQISPAHPIQLPLDGSQFINWLPAAVCLSAVGTCFALISRFPRSAWMFFLLVASLLPVSNALRLVRPEGAFFSELYLVFPVAVFMLMLTNVAVELFESMRTKRVRAVKVVATLAVVWSLASVVVMQGVIPHWKDDLSLWQWGCARSPDSYTARSNLASSYFDKRNYSEALANAKLALAIEPNDAMAWSVQGKAQVELGQPAAGLQSLQKAMAVDPTDARHATDLVRLYIRNRDFQAAERLLHERVLRDDPKFALQALAHVYKKMGQPEMAARYLQRARALQAK